LLRKVRAHLTYANVMATLAVFIALGGTGYAALRIGSKQIRDNTVRSKDVRNDNLRGRDVRNSSLSGSDIAESSLDTVPRAQQAANATTLEGLGSADLTVKCPTGTALSAAGCIELEPRGAAVYGNAVRACSLDGRRLPTHAELLATFTNSPAGLAPLPTDGELTSSVFGDPLQVIVMTTDTGGVIAIGTDAGNERQFRCMASQSN
jgi:hypothetical protein